MPAAKQVYNSISQQEMLKIGGRAILDVDDPATDSDGASKAASFRYFTSKGPRGTQEARGAPHKELATKVPLLGAYPRQDFAKCTQKEAPGASALPGGGQAQVQGSGQGRAHPA